VFTRLPTASGRDGVGSIRLGSLGTSPFRCENPFYEGWISLDFLGFSRPNRDLSMGYAGFYAENCSRTLSWRERPKRAHAVEAIRKGGIVHGASLLQFLIVSKKLSSDPVEHAKPLLILSRGQHRHLRERPCEHAAGRRPPRSVLGLSVAGGVTGPRGHRHRCGFRGPRVEGGEANHFLVAVSPKALAISLIAASAREHKS
jgi:hypothetical protein